MRRNVLLLCALILVVGLLAGCQPSEQEQQREEFDHAIHETLDAISAFYLIGSTASTSSVQSATDRISTAWTKAEELSDGLEGIDISKASEAHDALVQAVEEIPDDAEQGEAMRTAMPLLMEFESDVQEIHEAGKFHQ